MKTKRTATISERTSSPNGSSSISSSIPDDPGRRGAVAIALRDDRMLVIRRSAQVVAPLVYCFPGGGIEAGETEEEAVIRECHEEIGVTLQPIRRLWECTTAWKVHLAWWLATFSPEIQPIANPREVESIHWLTPAEMIALPDLLPSNRDFLDQVLSGKIQLG